MSTTNVTTSRTPTLRLTAALAVALLGAACASEPGPVPSSPAALTGAPTASETIQPRITPDAEFRQHKPGAGPEKRFQVPPVKRFKLANGLAVILAENHDLPLVNVNLSIKTGGEANPRQLAGLADLVASMLDEGTTTRTALQISEEVDFLGANLGSGSSWEASTLGVSGLRRNLDKALAIWADVLLNPKFDDKEFARVKDNLLVTLARRKDSPPAVARLAYMRVLYGEGHPYGWPENGTIDSVKRATVADLKKFYATYYHPNNAVLAVAGDVTEADLRAMLDPLLAGWKTKKVPAVRLARAGGPAKTKVYLIDKAGAPQSSIRVGLVGMERKSPDFFPATLMNLVLGGTGFHRMGLNLREAKGWTYGASTSFEPRHTAGPWTAGGEFVAAHTADSVREILKEVARIRDEDVPADELRAAKDYIIKAFPARFATEDQLVSQMIGLVLFGLPDNYYDSYTAKIEAVTAAQVRDMARKYLQPGKLAIVVVGDRKAHQEALGRIAGVELLDLDGKPLTVTASNR
jgi:zinc protease